MAVIPRTRTWNEIFINALAGQMADARTIEHKIGVAQKTADLAEAVIQEHTQVVKDPGLLSRSWQDCPWTGSETHYVCDLGNYRLFAYPDCDKNWTATALHQGATFQEVLLISKGHGSVDIAKAVAMVAAVLHHEGRLTAES